MKPWLLLPPQFAHDIAPWALPLYARWTGLFADKAIPHWNPFEWRHLKFENRLGISGGVDKNAQNIKDWWNLGAGFVEVGTVTPRPQTANPGKIMDRNRSQQALWNKMGFPSGGSDLLKLNLQRSRPYQTPVFINIGKNRETSNENALLDYQKLVLELSPYADAFVVNISSPNTKGLRDLQSRESLQTLIRGLTQLPTQRRQPILLKLSPDLSPDALTDSLMTAIENDIDGIILTNTTLERPPGIDFPAEGGLSGLPLKDLSKRALIQTRKIFNRYPEKNLLLVSVGGIMTSEDVQERLNLGADLVQVYTALVFSGPCFFRKVARDIALLRSP